MSTIAPSGTPTAPRGTVAAPAGAAGRPAAARRHLPGRHQGTHVITTALPSRAADRDLRERRYLITQAIRVICFLGAALLPLPMPGRLALVLASIVLPWGAVVAANAGPARTRRRVDNTAPPTEFLPQATMSSSAPDADVAAPAGDAGPGRPERAETRWYRLRWRLSYALLHAYGPAELSGDSDPRQQMLSERLHHRTGRATGARPALPTGPARELPRPGAPQEQS